MAKKKIKIIKRQLKEIKKPSLREIKPKEEIRAVREVSEPRSSDGGEEIEEQEKGEEFAFDDIFDAGQSERKAPILPFSGVQEQELEGMLEGARGNKNKEKQEEKEGLKYDFEKPKYSFSGEKESEEMIDRERDISELITRLRKRDVMREAPRILTEKEEDTVSIVTPSEFRGGEFKEYITKYVEPHEKDGNISMHEDKKRDIKKYKRVL